MARVGEHSHNLRSLTGIRGVAAIFVVAYHVLQAKAVKENIPFDGLVSRAYLAVDLFFCLSGFLLARKYAFALRCEPSLGAFGIFLRRRIARIFPVYFTLLFVYAAKDYAGAVSNTITTMTAVDWLVNLLMMTNWGFWKGGIGIVGSAWSVSTELLAYLWFPVFVVVIFRTAKVFVPIGIYVIAVATLYMVTRTGLGVNGSLDVVTECSIYPELRCLAGFTIGIITFEMTRAGALDKFLGNPISPVFAVLNLILSVQYAPDLFIVAIVFPTSIASLAKPMGIGDCIFGNKIFFGAGLVSYPIYLTQTLFIGTTLRFVDQARMLVLPQACQLVVVQLILTITSSIILYLVIEVPGQRLLLMSFYSGPRQSAKSSC